MTDIGYGTPTGDVGRDSTTGVFIGTGLVAEGRGLGEAVGIGDSIGVIEGIVCGEV